MRRYFVRLAEKVIVLLSRLVDRLLSVIAYITQPLRVWHRWPFLLSVAIVIGHRANLRNHNLFDAEADPPQPNVPPNFDLEGWRTYDGSHNDRKTPWMGMARAHFGRNVPLQNTYPESPETLYEPNPRVISNRLLARDKFIPVPHLNVLAAAWIQFMVHDWLTHGPNNPQKKHTIPLPADDEWRRAGSGDDMQILATTLSRATAHDGDTRPATYRNYATHWWDGSQVYGSNYQKAMRLRGPPGAGGQPGAILEDGKMWLDENGHLPIDETSKHTNPAEGIQHELAGENGNWWIGLSVLHTLFVREHNAIVDRLKIDYPKQSGEWLFQKARLVNAALIAKIHTVEWTPALMDSPAGRIFMRGNFWGLTGEKSTTQFGRVSDSEVIAGIPGTPVDHHGTAFSMTEEFTAAYRMHPLLPDAFDMRSHDDNRSLLNIGLTDVAMGKARGIYDRVPFQDVVYSLATENAGALTLHNYPNALRQLDKKRMEGLVIDLAAVDILRDRERGVPRFKEFRKLIGASEPQTFADITTNETWQRELKEIYGTVDKVDLMVGIFAESKSKEGAPPGFGFSDTAFRVFIVMASRRLKSDRFYTDDFRPEIYTPVGFKWVQQNSFASVIERHCPALARHYAQSRNPFFPWSTAEQ